jgi:glycosyltransferase involved in cell wall biosynthesis
MRICILRPLFGISGLDSSIINLALELQKDHELLFLSGTDYRYPGIKTKKSKTLSNLLKKKAVVGETEKLLKDLSDFNVIIFPSAQKSENHFLIKQIKKYTPNVKIINRCGNPLSSKDEVKITKLCDLNIVTATSVMKSLLENGIKPSEIALIRNPVPDRFRNPDTNKVSALKRKYRINGPVILYPTRFLSFYHGLETRKGLIIILKSFFEIAENEKDISLVIAGNDPFHKQRYKIIKNLEKKLPKSVKGKLIFLDEKDCHYSNFHVSIQAADLVLHPNIRKEPFGSPVLESAAAKKPIIITPLVGAVEVMKTEKFFLDLKDKSKADVIIIHPNDTDELSRTVLLLLKNQKLRKQIGKNAAERVREFNPKRYAKQFIEAIRKLNPE